VTPSTNAALFVLVSSLQSPATPRQPWGPDYRRRAKGHGHLKMSEPAAHERIQVTPLRRTQGSLSPRLLSASSLGGTRISARPQILLTSSQDEVTCSYTKPQAWLSLTQDVDEFPAVVVGVLWNQFTPWDPFVGLGLKMEVIQGWKLACGKARWHLLHRCGNTGSVLAVPELNCHWTDATQCSVCTFTGRTS
jgi:hypothetical protein